MESWDQFVGILLDMANWMDFSVGKKNRWLIVVNSGLIVVKWINSGKWILNKWMKIVVNVVFNAS